MRKFFNTHPLINNHDGYEDKNGVWYPSGDVQNYNRIAPDGRYTGLIYPNVPIVRHTRITDAWINIYVWRPGVKVNIYLSMFAEANAANFKADGSNRPSLRSFVRTRWYWYTYGPNWGWLDFRHLKDDVQDLVNQDEWKAGNSMGATFWYKDATSDMTSLDWSWGSFGYSWLKMGYWDYTSIPAKKRAWSGYTCFTQQFIKNRIKGSEPLKFPTGQLW